MKRHFMFLFVLAFCVAPLQCATLERLSLDEMILKSTSIVRGTVGGSHSVLTGQVIYTHFSIQVSEWLKGSGQSTVDLAVPGGVIDNLRQSFAGAPDLHPGDQYVFFLWTGKSGLTQVIGLTQGLFAISQTASSPAVATRFASHELMLARGTGRPVADQTISMPLSELKSRISATLAAGAAK